MTQNEIHRLNKDVLKSVIGRSHSIATASSYNIEQLWQVMPNHPEDYKFFDWYCHVRPYMQFFENCYETTTMYLYYRNIWIEKGMPYWRDVPDTEIDNSKPCWFPKDEEEDNDE